MDHIAISMWEAEDGSVRDAALENARVNVFPALRSLGALKLRSVALSDTKAMLITEWPDEATRSAAMEQIRSMRSEATRTMGLRLTDEFRGDVLIEG